MAAAIFDCLEFEHKSIELGCPRPLAEYQAKVLNDALNAQIVNKQEFHLGLEALKNELKIDMQLIKKDILLKTGAIVATATVIIISYLSFIFAQINSLVHSIEKTHISTSIRG